MDAEYAVPIEEALDRLDVIPDYDAGSGPAPCVHTFMQSAVGLLGAHWYLPTVKAAFERWGVEEAGDSASRMNHALVVIKDGKTPVFFATKAEGVPGDC